MLVNSIGFKWFSMVSYFIYAVVSYILALQFRDGLLINVLFIFPLVVLIMLALYHHEYENLKINYKSTVLLLVLGIVNFWLHYNVSIKYQTSTFYGAVCHNSANLITLGSILAYYGCLNRSWNFEKHFWILGVTFGTVMMFMLPLRAVPDENMHIYTAYQMSELMMNHIQSKEEEIPMRKTDREIFIEPVEMNYDIEMAERQYSLSVISADLSYSETLSEDSVLWNHDMAYLVSASAMTLAKALNLNGFYTIMAGRIANLFLYLVLCYFAVKMIPFNKMIPAGIACLPMSLQQGMSYSYDSLIISSSLFVVSATLYLYFKAEESTQKKYLYIGAITLFSIPLVMLKSHAYFLIGLFPLFMYLHKCYDMSKMMRIVTFISVIFIALFVTYAFIEYFMDFPDVLSEPSNPIKWPDNQQGYTIQFFINNPLKMIYVFVRTFIINFSYYWRSAVSSHLGWLNIITSSKYVFVFSILLLLDAQKSGDKEMMNIDGTIKTYSAYTVLITVFGIVLALFITWTPLWSTVSQGVQGRYFIPIMIFLLLMIRNRKVVFEEKNQLLLFFVTEMTLIMFFASFLVRL